eukprot:comp15977_c0_seq1/m.13392 comp15977_c0_seq1/g.13392  ORF comp15977_c0_seq1/g.13392 comp15977_c0_seq1/m.13392 type:complete len:878 (-) comp15977_c0_seq1:252-2885(-)
MHRAFEVVPIIERPPTRAVGDVEALAAHGNLLYVGTSKGHLTVYDVSPGAEPHLLETRTNFTRKAITQLEVFPEHNLLLCLSDGYVNVHDLQTHMLLSQVTKSRGTVLFSCQSKPALTQQVPEVPARPTQGELRLACVLRRHLVILDWSGSTFVETKTFNLPDAARSVVWCANNLCIGFRREYIMMNALTGGIQDLFPTGRNQETLITRVDDFELLLSKDNASIFIGYDGKPTRQFVVQWSDIPTSMDIVSGYCVALLPRCIEVRTLQTHSVVQTLEMKAVKYIVRAKSTRGSMDILAPAYISVNNNVWMLSPVPLDIQIDYLLEAQEFEEALYLAERLEDGPHKEERLMQVRHLNAEHLLEQHKFEEAMNLFIQNDADPKMVIGYYPSLLPEEVKMSAQFPTTIANLSGEDLQNSIFALISFLSSKRDALDRAERDGMPITDEIRENRMVIDTYLLKCFVAVSPHNLQKLLKRPNHCNISESEKCLKQNKRIKDLLTLYEYKGLHRKALVLLQEQSSDPSSELSGVQHSVSYMQHLLPDNLDLVLEFSWWILQTHPQEGLRIFTSPAPTATGEPAVLTNQMHERILAHIETIAPGLARDYLEYMVKVENDPNPKYHNKLVISYVQAMMPLLRTYRASLNGAKAVEAGNEPGELGPLRRKLLEFLDTSQHYDAALMLQGTLFNELLEEKAALYGKIGRHEKALVIYAHTLDNPGLALSYCNRVHDPDNEATCDVYLSLLKVYLNPPAGREPMMQAAIQLLVENGGRIDTIKALELLPEDTLLAPLFPFLEAILQSTSKRKRQDQILKSLRKAEHLQVQDQLIHYRQGVVMVNHERMCHVCKKRLGISAVAVYPNGATVHFACMKDKPEAQIEPPATS